MFILVGNVLIFKVIPLCNNFIINLMYLLVKSHNMKCITEINSDYIHSVMTRGLSYCDLLHGEYY